jgi:GNAT superfamily N-acetyltransferase
MPITVALGDPSEVDAAVSVFVRSGQARRKGRPIPPDRIAHVRASLSDPASWFFVADDGGSTVGMALAMPSRSDDGSGSLRAGLCYLDLIFVVPERWGEGIGSAILDAVLADARTRGYRKVHLWTHDDNDRAQVLYRSRGFAPTGRSRPSASEEGSQSSEWACELSA